jgi:hypothetical protein
MSVESLSGIDRLLLLLPQQQLHRARQRLRRPEATMAQRVEVARVEAGARQPQQWMRALIRMIGELRVVLIAHRTSPPLLPP